MGLQERMAVLSTLLSKRLGTVLTQASRSMGGMTVRNRPSRWYYDKFKDHLHFYFLLAAIPLSLFTAYMNITIGEVQRPFSYLNLLMCNFLKTFLAGKVGANSRG